MWFDEFLNELTKETESGRQVRLMVERLALIEKEEDETNV